MNITNLLVVWTSWMRDAHQIGLMSHQSMSNCFDPLLYRGPLHRRNGMDLLGQHQHTWFDERSDHERDPASRRIRNAAAHTDATLMLSMVGPTA